MLDDELVGGYRWTTNNRMEVVPLIVGLEYLPQNAFVRVYSDSSYLVNCVNKWVWRWQRNDWLRYDPRLNKQVPPGNVDLWKRFCSIADNFTLQLLWVKGHDGNEWNEHADVLARQKGLELALPEDDGYVRQANTVAR